MKNLEQINVKFFNLIAGYYDFFFGNWIRKTQKKAINVVKIKDNSKILDAGCGTGNFLKILENSKKNLSLYGIDILLWRSWDNVRRNDEYYDGTRNDGKLGIFRN